MHDNLEPRGKRDPRRSPFQQRNPSRRRSPSPRRNPGRHHSPRQHRSPSRHRSSNYYRSHSPREDRHRHEGKQTRLVSPLTDELLDAKLPAEYRLPNIPPYNGLEDPLNFLTHFKYSMHNQGLNEVHMCKLFPEMLVNYARAWFDRLPTGSVGSWAYLEEIFKQRFHLRVQACRDTTYLLSVKQKDKEPIREYASRFMQESLKVDKINDHFLISAFRNGVVAGSLNQELAIKKPETAQEMWRIVYQFADGQDADRLKRDLFRTEKFRETMELTVPCGSYSVHTNVAYTTDGVRKWIHSTKFHRGRFLHRGRLVVGLGVQWVPGHTGAATLQLCVGYRCLIFQISRARECPVVLHRFLANPDVIFVGISNCRDAKMLMASRHTLEVKRLVDIREVASDLRVCSRSASMGELAAAILGMHGMDKDETVGRSYWDNEELTADQVEYACHDAFLAFLMGKELQVWNWGQGDDHHS